MSGYCNFCGVWHSGSCCHPGRLRYDSLLERIECAPEPSTAHLRLYLGALTAGEVRIAKAAYNLALADLKANG